MKSIIRRSVFFTTIALLIGQQALGQTKSLNVGNIVEKEYFIKEKYELVKNKIIIPVVINGKVRRFIVDTGAPLVISHSLAEELQAKIYDTRKMTDQSELADTLKAVIVDSLVIGSAHFVNSAAIVAKDGNFFMECFNVDGFIGSNILRNSIIKFSNTDSTFIITSDVSKIPEINKYKPLKLILNRQSNPYVLISFRKKRIQEYVLFDSGQDDLYKFSFKSYNYLKNSNAIEVAHEGHGSNSIGFNGTAVDRLHYQLKVPSLLLGKSEISNFYASTTAGNESRIGSDILKYGDIVIDYKDKKFYFISSIDSHFELNGTLQNLELIIKDGLLVVGIVWNEELLNRISVGDQVIAIDGQSLENLSECELLMLPSKIKKTEIILDIKTQSGSIEEVLYKRL